ncbi:histidine ammonia-lyase [Bacillus sp. FSL W7-1360]
MIHLDGNTLTLEKMKAILFSGEKVALSEESIAKVKQSRLMVERIVAEGEIVYGITTGFGKFSDVRIEAEDVAALQKNLILSHACGVGPLFSKTITRAMMVLRANALAKGFSGVRLSLLEKLIELVNKEVYPCVPQQGSLGASGDLAPLSHLALVLMGEGEVMYQGEQLETKVCFARLSIAPIVLEAKEGLALINGTQAMTAVGVVAYLEAACLFKQSELIAAITMEGLHGIMDAFDPLVHEARGYPEQIAVAARMRAHLEGSKLVSVQGEKRVQDAYTLRCIPQIHGATAQTLTYVKDKLTIEMNAATDNPLIFANEGKVISGGNFHGQPIAFAMDYLAIAMAELASVSERRIERLVNPQLNDLPPFLSAAPGLQSGAMIMQYVAAALVSENKTFAHPASVDSIPSSANQEDHVSMGTIGARHAYQVIENVRRVYAIEAICALQAVDIRGAHKMAPVTHAFYTAARHVVPFIDGDRVFSKDIEAMTAWLHAAVQEPGKVMANEVRGS